MAHLMVDPPKPTTRRDSYASVRYAIRVGDDPVAFASIGKTMTVFCQ